MTGKAASAMAAVAEAHREASRVAFERVRALSIRERSQLIEAACEAAAVVYRSRLAAGLADVEPSPWPESTWEFLREHAARVGR
jgi:hypothetical protein